MRALGYLPTAMGARKKSYASEVDLVWGEEMLMGCVTEKSKSRKPGVRGSPSSLVTPTSVNHCIIRSKDVVNPHLYL